MKVASYSLLVSACAGLAACGGSSADKVVSVSVGPRSDQPVLVASLRPGAYRGRGWVIPLSVVRRALPARMPPNVSQRRPHILPARSTLYGQGQLPL